MKVKDLKEVSRQSGFRYYEGAEFVTCRNCGVQYRIKDGNAGEMMISHYPYCRGQGRNRWFPEYGKQE